MKFTSAWCTAGDFLDSVAVVWGRAPAACRALLFVIKPWPGKPAAVAAIAGFLYSGSSQDRNSVYRV